MPRSQQTLDSPKNLYDPAGAGVAALGTVYAHGVPHQLHPEFLAAFAPKKRKNRTLVIVHSSAEGHNADVLSITALFGNSTRVQASDLRKYAVNTADRLGIVLREVKSGPCHTVHADEHVANPGSPREGMTWTSRSEELAIPHR